MAYVRFLQSCPRFRADRRGIVTRELMAICMLLHVDLASRLRRHRQTRMAARKTERLPDEPRAQGLLGLARQITLIAPRI